MKAAHSSPPDFNIKQSIYFRRTGYPARKMMKLETSHKKTYSKFVCVYPNFSLDTEGLFTYNNNEFVATWNKNTESDLHVESINPITLQLLSKILSECINLL